MAKSKSKSKPISKPVPRQSGSVSISKPVKRRAKRSIPYQRTEPSIYGSRQAADNMLTVLGGRESVLQLLADSSNPKALRLIERMNSTAHAGENFGTSYTSVGLKALDILEIFGDVQQAKVFIAALQEGDHVMQSLIRSAKDKIEPHEKCDGSGKVLDKQGKPTKEECKKCHGSGYVLLSGSRESQELYFKLIGWIKQGSMVNIDARRQQATVNAPGSQVVIAGLPANGTVPDVVQIIRRADQQLLPPASSGQLGADSSEMPEDVMEAVEV